MANDTNDKNDTNESKGPSEVDKMKEKLNQLWNGEIPLAQTFWLYYFVGILLLRIVANAVGPIGAIIILGWAGFMVLPIWRAADKYTGNKLFGLLAKIAAVLIALGVIGSVL